MGRRYAPGPVAGAVAGKDWIIKRKRRDIDMTEDKVMHKDSVAQWLVRLLKGVAVGVGAILPGLSGGVLAVIFNIYEPLVRFLGNVRKNFLANLKYFIPIGLGGALGVVLFSLFVEKAFGRFAAQFTCLFIGFVAGTIPVLFRTAGKQGRRRADWIILSISALIIALLMIFGGSLAAEVTPSFPVWIFSGALIGLGVIVPGMSPSNFLIYLGLYDKMAAGISSLDYGVIIPLALGLLACVLLFAKGASWLFDRFYSEMYHLIIGTVIGSSLAIFPTVVLPAMTPQGLAASGLTLPGAVALALIMFLCGTVFSYAFSRLESRVGKEEAS